MSSDVLFTPMTETTDCRVNGERLWESLMALAEIGATPKGGCCRLTLTDLDRQGRDLVISWAQAAGMRVTVDKIGNVFMRREGRNPALPPIVSGSHIDTQPTGGKFDGNYGVLAALERRGLLERSALVSNCGLPGEQVYADLSAFPREQDAGYFATIIVKED